MKRNPVVDLARSTQRYIHMSNVAKACKVVSKDTQGTYTVTSLDGLTYSNVKNQSGTTWAVNQWVTLEYMGGDYMITGLSSHRGGD